MLPQNSPVKSPPLSKVFFFSEVGGIWVDGDQATARSYTRETMHFRAGGSRELVGRYDDSLVRETGRWRFIRRIYTDVEQARSDGRAARAASYAKRFAAKEACAKALGTGIRRGVFWRDMGVVNMRSGQPTMALTGGALARLEEMTPPGMKAVIHLSLTDDHPYAQAFVIIEAVAG